MNKYCLPILVLLIFVAIFIFSGGFYRFENLQTGVVQRTNTFTGEILVYVVKDGCTSLSGSLTSEEPSKPLVQVDNQAFYTLSFIRQSYPQYDDIDDF